LRGANSAGLIGTFYDLKQTQGGQPTGMSPGKYSQTVLEFTQRWDAGDLARYFKGPEQLALNQLYIPAMKATEGPKAFNLEKEVQPRMWLVHYKGTVVPPKGGRFRFVGHGDDLVIVRFDKKVVLCAAQHDAGKLTDWTPSESRRPYPGSGRAGLLPGDWVSVTGGQAYPIEILIGERPGSGVWFILLLEESGAKYQEVNGFPVLPLFRVGTAPMPKTAWIPFREDGAVWRTREKGYGGLLGR
jgi:hypothetical protein